MNSRDKAIELTVKARRAAARGVTSWPSMRDHADMARREYLSLLPIDRQFHAENSLILAVEEILAR